MSDFADDAAAISELHISLALLQHRNMASKPAPHPECDWCEQNLVEILPNGAKSRYCAECKEEATQ